MVSKLSHETTTVGDISTRTIEICNVNEWVPQDSILGPILFLLFINDISNFTTEGCVLNMYADDVIIYTSANTIEELKSKLQNCVNSITCWYSRNKLAINNSKTRIMVIGSKCQLKSLELDNFFISLNKDKLGLVEKAKYLGLYVKNDLSWDDRILHICKNANYYLHVLRRLRHIFPRQLCCRDYHIHQHDSIHCILFSHNMSCTFFHYP